MSRSAKRGIAVWIGLMILMAVLYAAFNPGTARGDKAYTLKVTGPDGSTTEYKAVTGSEYLKSALDELAEAQDFSYDGKEGDPGFMIETVNGVTANYRRDHAYWAIYDNGKYASRGVSTLPVRDSHTYLLKDTEDRE